ncbi:hypothetical protein V8C44DRAFT_337756 [Trichoderma aethiopicum]
MINPLITTPMYSTYLHVVEPAASDIRYHQVQYGGVVLSEGPFQVTGGPSTRPCIGALS